MDDLAEALKFTTQLAGAAHDKTYQPHQYKIDGLPRKRFVTFQGETKEFEVDPPARLHAAGDLDSFVRLVKDAAEATDVPTVWHAGDAVLAILDGRWAQNRIGYTLPATVARVAIKQLGGKVHKQKDLIRLLKTTLAGTGLDTTLLEAVKAVNFVAREETAGIVAATSHSLGNKVEREVLGLPADLPDVLLATFGWWSVGTSLALPGRFDKQHLALALPASSERRAQELNSLVSIRVHFEVDHEEKGFRLSPLADDLERAAQLAEARLHDWLVAQTTLETVDDEGELVLRSIAPVYHGTP